MNPKNLPSCETFHIASDGRSFTLTNTFTGDFIGHVIPAGDEWRAFIDYKNVYLDLGTYGNSDDAVENLWMSKWDYYNETAPTCGHCGNQSAVYENEGSVVYECYPCNTRTGTHAGTCEPLGTLADRELGKLRKDAHDAFDPLWQNSDARRKDVYAWLARELGIKVKDCHMGLFNADMCKKVIEVCT